MRGNTIKKIVQMCREAGAKKVYIASASPPVKYPNVYGIDMPTKHELIANGRSIEEIREELGADELFYQNLEDLIWAAQGGNPDIDTFGHRPRRFLIKQQRVAKARFPGRRFSQPCGRRLS
mgnify:CR=1 FL=1